MKCVKCGRSHPPSDLCPIGLHVVIDEATVERACLTGHPRLLKAVLNGDARAAMNDISITRLRVNPVEAAQ